MELHNKKSLQGSIILILIILIIGGGCSLFPVEEDVLTPPLAEPEEITYKTEEVTTGYIEDSIERTAYFVPVLHENLYFPYQGGRLKEFKIKLGDEVKAGDLIAELLSDGLEREIELQTILVDSKMKDCLYTEQLAQIEINTAENKLSSLNDKYRSIYQKTEIYAANDIEKTLEEMKNQELVVEKVKLSYSNQIEIKKNELVMAELKLKQLNDELERHKLFSPVSGIITYTLNASEGDIINAYSTVATVTDPKVLQLEYKGDAARNFVLGMELEVTINKEKYSGEVILTPSSVPYEEIEKYKDTILIKLKKMPAGVEKGDRATIKLVKNFSENAVIIPKRALRPYMGKNLVYVLEDGLRVEKYVETGVESTTEIEIIKGVEPGEQVIID